MELATHAEWYDTYEPGLGTDFELAVYDGLAHVVAHPQAWPAWEGLHGVRYYPMDRFPFLLPYEIHAAQIVVLAVAHQRREPGYWTTRT